MSEPAPTTRHPRRNHLLLLTLLVVSTTWISPFGRELFVGDETKYSRVVHALIESDDWLVLRLDGRPYSHKPPLHFWAVGSLTRLFGLQSTWAFVLPSLVSFLVLLLVIRQGMNHLFGRADVLAVFLFATFYLCWGLAQTARMDVAYVLLISLGAFAIHRWFVEGRRWSLDLAAFWIGIATLVKGPMAIVIASTLFAIESVRRHRRPRLWMLRPLLILLAVPLAWLIPASLSAGGSYVEQLLVRQSLGRAFGSWVHAEPPWFYLLHFPVTFFPWSLLVVVSIIAVFRRSHGAADRDVLLFLVSWFLAVLIPYSLIRSKLDVYMLPAMVPAALLGAAVLRDDREDRLSRFLLVGHRWIAGCLALLFAAVISGGPFLAQVDPIAAEWLQKPSIRTFFAVGFVAFAVAWAALGRRTAHPRRSSIILGTAALAPLVFLVLFLMPLANEEASTRPLIRSLQAAGAKGSDIALAAAPHLWSREMPGSFHDARYVEKDFLRDGGTARFVVVRRDRTEELGPALGDYEQVDRVRMIGKEFDVYRRR